MSKIAEHYQAVTDTIVAQLEKGVRPWQRETAGGYAGLPLRHEGTPYRGANIIVLWVSAMTKGYTQPYWMTFKQGLELGGNVRKGSKSTRISYYSAFDKEGEGDSDPQRIPFSKIYSVFNIDQFEGLDMQKFPHAMPEVLNAHDHADPDYEPLRSFIANIPATIDYHAKNKPCYRLREDRIEMPTLDRFKSQIGFYSTTLHECGHWTGHKSRLDRAELGKSQFSTAEGAFEELVAELTSAFVCASLHQDYDPSGNPATYIESYLKLLKAHPNAIFKAAAEAQKAADLLTGFQTPKEVAA